MPKTRIKQVQSGVLHSSIIPINRHPILQSFFRGKFLIIVRITITQEIPRRPCPVWHGISLSACMAATFRTSGIEPITGFRKRRFAFIIRMIIRHRRQSERQLRFRDRLPTAFFTINHRNRFTPITLTREHPITQFEVNFCPPKAMRSRILNSSFHAVFFIHTVQET